MFTKNELITGNSGSVTANINGTIREIGEIRTMTATITKTKFSYKQMGKKGTQHKTTGWEGTGSTTIYLIDNQWTKLAIDAAKSGIDPDISFTCENTRDDGTVIRRVWLGGVITDSDDIFSFDTDADYMESSFDFTFDDVEDLT